MKKVAFWRVKRSRPLEVSTAHKLSNVLKRIFIPFPIASDNFHCQSSEACDDASDSPPLVYYTNRKRNNYGQTVFPHLGEILPSVWKPSLVESGADLTNNNRGRVGWYIDDMENFTVKGNLTLKNSQYAIPFASAQATTGARYKNAWILKPSHPHVGSGELISISENLDELLDTTHRPRNVILKNGVRVSLNLERDWIVQPLIITPALWSRGRKFDCRFFAVIYRMATPRGKKRFAGAILKLGVARVSVMRHDPLHNPTSAITNISVQAQLPDYDPKVHMPLIYDDISIGRDILSDLVHKSNFEPDQRKSAQIIILGIDVLFVKTGRSAALVPMLIEVNHQPHLDLVATNSEGFCSRAFVRGVFGNIIPNLLCENTTMCDMAEWDWV